MRSVEQALQMSRDEYPENRSGLIGAVEFCFRHQRPDFFAFFVP